jgi:HEAT repeat protein
VVAALLTAAYEDESPTVRAECVRSLSRVKPCSPTVLAAFRTLQADPDVRVRSAAAEALAAAGRPDLVAAVPQPVSFGAPR